jgi:hypothetical protein
MLRAAALVLAAIPCMAADFPSAEIASAEIRMRVLLPDPERGYYRGTRFDWSGAVSSLVYRGHEYFGQWFEKYDPKLHDAIMGPVEEFMPKAGSLGYDDAAPGGHFVRIGVGAVVKRDSGPYQRFSTYEIADPGKWTVNRGPDWIEFVHELKDTSGYAYVYRKTLRLAKDRPELVLEHTLKNTGRKRIESSVYEHNFFMLDGKPTGPGIVVTFPFEARTTQDLGGLAEVRGKEWVYLRELARGQTAQSEVVGFGPTAVDYDIRVENHNTGAAVRQTGDRPITKINFWSIRSTVCPEPYIDLRIEPGEEARWRISYLFYTVPVQQR